MALAGLGPARCARPVGSSLAESPAWERPARPCPEPGRGRLKQAQGRSADDWLRANVRAGCHGKGHPPCADRHALRSARLNRQAAIRQIRCKATRLVGPATSPLEIWRAKPYVSSGIVARWDSLPPTTGFIPQPVRYSAYPRAGLLAAVSYFPGLDIRAGVVVHNPSRFDLGQRGRRCAGGSMEGQEGTAVPNGPIPLAHDRQAFAPVDR
jgi:hypothetical protein